MRTAHATGTFELVVTVHWWPGWIAAPCMIEPIHCGVRESRGLCVEFINT